MESDPRTSPTFSTAAAIRAGYSRAQLRHPDLQSFYHGVRSRGLDVTALEDRCRAYAERMVDRAAFSHLTAALLWGMPVALRHERSLDLHVAVPYPPAPSGRGIVGHRGPVGFPSTVLRGLRVVEPAVAWAQSATILDLPDLIAAGDFAVSGDPFHDILPLVGVDRLGAVCRALSGRPGHRARMSALSWIRGPVASRPETFSRLLFVSAGLPEPEVNFELRDHDRRLVAVLDLAWPAWHLGYDYLGEPHLRPGAFRRDTRRAERIRDQSWEHVQATALDLFDEPTSLLERVARKLRARGWSGIVRSGRFARFER